ncbi:MAG TPA: enoyl-CoA hydratase/isomerase family protein [Burkholderiales bacterium]|nr:enoyl-CoA hydratase/isomerase family protein [Burkholderiales bacterium]
MCAQLVKLDVQDYVATVTLDHPPVNALNSVLRQDIIETFDAITDRDDIRVAILTGAGKNFCAGADLKDRPNVEQPGAYGRHNRVTRETTNAIRECGKPVIAAVNGAALGAGLGLMVACDIMLASDDAVFGMPEINVGLAGGATTLRTLFGRSRMRRMLFTGYRVPAAELYRVGIIECCVPRERLLDEAMAIAREIAGKSPLGIKYAKISCNLTELTPSREVYRFEQGYTVELAKTEDAQEAKRAFLEKRKPRFKGR